MIAEVARLLDGLPFYQAVLLVLGGSILLAIAIQRVGLTILGRMVRRTESRFDDIVLEELRLPIVISVFLAGVWLLTLSDVASTTLITQEQLDQFFGKPSLSVIIVAWAWAANQIVNRGVASLQAEGRQLEFAPILSNIWTLFVILGGAFALLSLWQIDITPLLGAAGIAGIAIGFAAKDTVANFFGGLALYFDDTYKLGDFVVLESGEAGTVVKVGIRSTTLLTRSEVLVTVPNSMLNAGKVVNQSAPQRRKRIKVPVGVAYGTDIDAFEELAMDVAAAEDLVLAKPDPRIRFRRFGDSALEYELLGWVGSPTQEGRAVHNLNRALYRELEAAEIEIPFPQRDLTVRTETGDAAGLTGNGETPGAVDAEEPAER
jgi:small-conductance mechanosensitive channel